MMIDHDDDDDDDDDDSENSSYSSLHYSDRARRILSEIRIPLYRWMVSLQVPSTGGYRMQHDGEVDVRATYTIACCSKLLGLLETPTNTKTNTASTTIPTTTKKTFTALGRPLVIDFVKSCQTYEGGMGGEPFSEAHGGYTFCAVAALKLLGALNNSNNRSNSSHGFDVSTLLGWLGRRQLSYEGGFSGRSNKLVDGCYSFWQGSAMAIASSCSECLAGEDEESGSEDRDGANDPWLARYRQQTNPAINLPTDAASTSTTNNPDDSDTNNNSPPNLPFPLLYDVFLLERYILLCAQEVTGGLRDKPSKPRDFYHTCYNLSGLSIAQHSSSSMSPASDDENETEKVGFGDPKQTLVGQTHPCYNLRIDRVAAILEIDWGE
jgi:protein farnesyltransferase subunit beta